MRRPSGEESPAEFLARIKQTVGEEAVKTVASNSKPLSFSDLKIIDKEGREVAFQPNVMQSKFNDVVFKGNPIDWRVRPVGMKRQRRLILKGRQFGFSTNTLGLFFIDTVSRGGIKTIIVAQDQKSTVELFKKIQLFHERLPDWMKERIGPASAASKFEFFWPKIQSSFLVGTAGSEEFGRSQTCQNVLLSELPSWPEGAAEGIFTGMLKAVPLTGNIIIESTAKGIGNHFYRMWMNAINKKSTYRANFYSWKDFPEYVIPSNLWEEMLPGGFGPFYLTEEERDIKAAFKLSMEQIAFRRYQQLDLPDPDLVEQEFPLTWERAFVSSSQSFFGKSTLARVRERVESQKNNVKNGIEGVPGEYKNLKQCLTTSNEGTKKDDVFLKVWKWPNELRQATVTADVPEGLNGLGKQDFASASVWDEKWEQVAHLHGNWPPHVYARILIELAYWYSQGEGCLLCPEANNDGKVVISEIQNHTDYPLGMDGLYLHKDYDKYGWQQNVKTRPYALACGEELLRGGHITVNSERTLSELETFVKREKKKIEAIPGYFDDCVLDFCIFAAIVYNAPRPHIKPSVGGAKKIVPISVGASRNFTPPNHFSLPSAPSAGGFK